MLWAKLDSGNVYDLSEQNIFVSICYINAMIKILKTKIMSVPFYHTCGAFSVTLK
jgi:hypothetical protein